MSRRSRPGPPRVDAAAFAPPHPGDHPPVPASSAARKKSTVVAVDADLLARFRAHCASTRRSPTEVILTAHLQLAEQLQDELKPTPADQRRIVLGLPQVAASRGLGPGKPLSLWLSAVSLAALDDAAKGVGVTRRRYVTALVAALLATACPPGEPHPESRPDPTT